MLGSSICLNDEEEEFAKETLSRLNRSPLGGRSACPHMLKMHYRPKWNNAASVYADLPLPRRDISLHLNSIKQLFIRGDVVLRVLITKGINEIEVKVTRRG